MRKYQTEEERKKVKRQRNKQWYEANKEKVLEQSKQRYQANREKIVEYNKNYYEINKEKFAEHNKNYYEINKERITEQMKQRYQTPMGRASKLSNAYNREDKKYNRGECSLTSLWIHNYIFPFKCIYCGEYDWTKLGCDRKDNSLPHTPNNVVPCCGGCNKKRRLKSFETFITECNAEGRLKEWEEFLKQKDL